MSAAISWPIRFSRVGAFLLCSLLPLEIGANEYCYPIDTTVVAGEARYRVITGTDEKYVNIYTDGTSAELSIPSGEMIGGEFNGQTVRVRLGAFWADEQTTTDCGVICIRLARGEG